MNLTWRVLLPVPILLLSGCLDLPGGVSTGTGPTPSLDPSSFRLECYRAGGHTVLLPTPWVVSHDSSRALSMGGDRTLICYSTRERKDPEPKITVESWTTPLLRIDSEGKATYFDKRGEFAHSEPFEYDVVVSTSSGDPGIVLVHRQNVSIVRGDIWRLGSETVAERWDKLESWNLTFHVPPGYDTSP